MHSPCLSRAESPLHRTKHSSKRRRRMSIQNVVAQGALKPGRRRSVQNLIDGFNLLRSHLPSYSSGRQLTQIETLRLAMLYINDLTELLQRPESVVPDGGDPQPFQRVSSKSNSPPGCNVCFPQRKNMTVEVAVWNETPGKQPSPSASFSSLSEESRGAECAPVISDLAFALSLDTDLISNKILSSPGQGSCPTLPNAVADTASQPFPLYRQPQTSTSIRPFPALNGLFESTNGADRLLPQRVSKPSRVDEEVYRALGSFFGVSSDLSTDADYLTVENLSHFASLWSPPR